MRSFGQVWENGNCCAKGVKDCLRPHIISIRYGALGTFPWELDHEQSIRVGGYPGRRSGQGHRVLFFGAHRHRIARGRPWFFFRSAAARRPWCQRLLVPARTGQCTVAAWATHLPQCDRSAARGGAGSAGPWRLRNPGRPSDRRAWLACDRNRQRGQSHRAACADGVRGNLPAG